MRPACLQSTYRVISYSYDQGQTYSPPERTDLNYKVADQLVVQTYMTKNITSVVDFDVAFSEYLSTELTTFNIGASVKALCEGVPGVNNSCLTGSINWNHEAYKYHVELSGSDRAASQSLYRVTFYTVQIAVPPFLLQLDPGFNSLVQALPATIKTPADQAQYNLIVKYYGTHFSREVTIGAYINMGCFLNKSFLVSKSSEWCANQVSLSFDWNFLNLNVSGFHNRSDIHISQDWREHATNYTFFWGGNTSYQSINTLTEWLSSAWEAPAWTRVDVMDLSELLPLSMSAQANNLLATAQYFLKTGALPSTAQDVDLVAQLAPHFRVHYPRSADQWELEHPEYASWREAQPNWRSMYQAALFDRSSA